MPACLLYSLAGSSSSTAIPINCRPWLPYCFCNSINSGISFRQGAHQVAQKFRTITLPCHSERRRRFPSRSGKVISGSPAVCVLFSCGCAVIRCVRIPVPKAINATKIVRKFFSFVFQPGLIKREIY